MKFAQIKPPDHLRTHVKSFWTLEYSVDSAAKIFRTIADACPGLIFQQTNNGQFYQNNKLLPPVFLYGPATTHAELSTHGKSRITGVFLYPSALKSIFGLNADELTDSCIDIKLIPATKEIDLAERLLHSSSTRDHIEIMSNYLTSQIKKIALT